MEHQEYIDPVVCVNTTEELFYKTWNIIGVYLPCCVWYYCKGALLYDKEHQKEYNLSVVFGSTEEELFCTTWSTSRNISTLLCVLIQQRSSSIRHGAS